MNREINRSNLTNDVVVDTIINHIDNLQIKIFTPKNNNVRKYHLYVIYNQYTKLSKIGISDNLEKRLQQLSNACGVKLYLAFKSEAIINATHMESTLHNQFANHRKMGEWFDCDPKIIINSILLLGLTDIRPNEISIAI